MFRQHLLILVAPQSMCGMVHHIFLYVAHSAAVVGGGVFFTNCMVSFFSVFFLEKDQPICTHTHTAACVLLKLIHKIWYSYIEINYNSHTIYIYVLLSLYMGLRFDYGWPLPSLCEHRLARAYVHSMRAQHTQTNWGEHAHPHVRMFSHSCSCSYTRRLKYYLV